jgi:hypothetical protein
MFSAKKSEQNQTLTIWLMSTVMKYLQKRTLRYFRRVASFISYFTISTCKCGFFGGLSNLTSKNLQNAMGGRMTINSLRIGRDLSNVAIKFQALPEETNRTRFDKIIARFIEGNVSTTGLTGPEKLLMILCLEPVYTRWQTLLFKRQIHSYTQDYKKGEAGRTTGTVTIEGSVYSMDSPCTC